MEGKMSSLTLGLLRFDEERYGVYLKRIMIGMVFISPKADHIEIRVRYGVDEVIHSDNVPLMPLDDPCIMAHVSRATSIIQTKIREATA